MSRLHMPPNSIPRRVSAVLLLAVSGSMLVWTCVEVLRQTDMSTLQFLTYVCLSIPLFLGCGAVCERLLLGRMEQEYTGTGSAFRWSLGVCTVTIVAYLGYFAGSGRLSIQSLVVVGCAGMGMRFWSWLKLRGEGDTVAPHWSGILMTALCFSTAAKVSASGMSVARAAPDGAHTVVLQDWDILWTLAWVKELAFRPSVGLPVHACLTGAPWGNYHWGVHTLLGSVASCGVSSVDDFYFGVAIPMGYFSLCVAVYTAASTLSRSRSAGILSVLALILGPTVAVALLKTGVVAHTLPTAVLARYFITNSQAGLGAIFVLTVFTLLVMSSRGNRRAPFLAAALVGWLFRVKAHFWLPLAPSLLFAVWAVPRANRWRRLVGVGFVLACAGGLAYAVPSARLDADAGRIGFEWGRLAEQMAQQGGGPILGRVYSVLVTHWNPVSPLLVIACYFVGTLLSWRVLVPCGLLLLSGRKLRLRPSPTQHALFVACAAVLAFLACLMAVRANSGVYTTSFPLQVSRALLPITYAFFGACSVRVLAQYSGVQFPFWRAHLAQPLLAAVLVFSCISGSWYMRCTKTHTGRRYWWPKGFMAVASAVPDVTPNYAVIAHGCRVGRDPIVAGLGGRRVVLERGESWEEFWPREVQQRKGALQDILKSGDHQKVQSACDLYGVTHVILGPGDALPEGHDACEVLEESDGWALVEL